MLYIGIDPGQSGGIAIIDSAQDDELPDLYSMPETERDIWNLIYRHSPPGSAGAISHGQVFCVIERVSSMPRQGVASSFKFGMGYGGLRMALIAAEIPFMAITPGQWQRQMKCLSGGDKNVTKRKAQELHPGLKITHKTADALLLATYCRSLYDETKHPRHVSSKRRADSL